MQARTTSSCIVVAAATLASAGIAIGQGSVVFHGVARDFLDTHPDFNVASSARQAANVAGQLLDADGKPVFSGASWEIATQWRDIGTKHIPYDYAAFGLPDGRMSLINAPTLNDGAVIDMWDPASGPYDEDTAGTPQILTGQPMPSVTIPTAGLANVGELLFDGHGVSTITTDYRCQKLLVKTHHRVHISGDVTIVVTEEFKVENQAKIILDPGAHLTLYLQKDATMQNQALLNANTQDPSQVTIYHMSNLDFMIQDQSQVYANIISPTGRLLIQNGSDVFGSYTGARFFAKNQGGFHMMGSGVWACGFDDDHLGAPGVATANKVTSVASFGQWFEDIPGVNASKMVGLEMHWQAGGFYEYTTSDFRPIDGELLGAGQPVNRFFTFEGLAGFWSTDCSGGFIEIECHGEAWVFIGDRRVLDIGAPGVGKIQRINVDRLGLTPNTLQTLRVFYAQRTGNASPLTIRTNLDLFSMKPETPVSALYD